MYELHSLFSTLIWKKYFTRQNLNANCLLNLNILMENVLLLCYGVIIKIILTKHTNVVVNMNVKSSHI